MIKAEIISYSDYEKNWKDFKEAEKKSPYYLVFYSSHDILMLYPLLDPRDENNVFRAFSAAPPGVQIRIIMESEREMSLPDPFSVFSRDSIWQEHFPLPKISIKARQKINENLLNSSLQFSLEYAHFILADDMNSSSASSSLCSNKYLLITKMKDDFSFTEIMLEDEISSFHYSFSVLRSKLIRRHSLSLRGFEGYNLKELSSLFQR